MSIDLQVSKIENWEDTDDEGTPVITGTLSADNLILWLAHTFSPGHLANAFCGYVKYIDEDSLVIFNSYLVVHQLGDGLIRDHRALDRVGDYGWRYEFTRANLTSDFDLVTSLLWTFAKAWGAEYPAQLGMVIDQHNALMAKQV